MAWRRGVLEFYPFHQLVRRRSMTDARCPLHFGASLSRARFRALAPALTAALTLLVTACAQTGAVQPSSPSLPSEAVPGLHPSAPSTVEPPPPGINLSGFPLPYRQGYADGCASVKGTERKDAARFAADGNYRTGWQDGLALCRKR
jgi:hypothetical protein